MFNKPLNGAGLLQRNKRLLARLKPGRDISSQNPTTIIIGLGEVTVQFRQVIRRLLVFNTLCGHCQSKTLSEVYRRANYGNILRFGRKTHNKRFIDLNLIKAAA